MIYENRCNLAINVKEVIKMLMFLLKLSNKTDLTMISCSLHVSKAECEDRVCFLTAANLMMALSDLVTFSYRNVSMIM